ncbi:kynureninase [Halovivax asiaticus JCM 14624]|uniref:Kynureninase n=1 Tax=Halovivax asiaticus JCM 14624 TaxID=1227490 RepID=M0BFB9_9EURY|nr:kynureninase [Halovivax asiaticus]ELZ09520.1 kynureninase [Halovivax asiaticus JCM 14624]
MVDSESDGDAVADAGRRDARERDQADPLADFRERFEIPDDYYMDGNSLGPISDAAEESLQRAVDQWRDQAIRGWTDSEPPWFWYGERLGGELAPLVGADPDEVVVGNSTTINIHTLVGTFVDAQEPDEPRGVLVNDLDFPTDHYAIQSQLRQRGLDPDEHLHLVESRDGRTIETEDVIDAMDANDVGIVFMPSVLYRSGQLFDIEAITEAAHERDVLVGFDLAHSIGVVPHDLSAIGVDFAVWCSYKYLNAGPGAVAGLYVNERHFGEEPALAGWWGHDKESQFELNLDFTPADDAGAWQAGTIPVFSAAPLFGALELTHDAGIEAVREKSIALTEYLIDLVDEHLADRGVSIGTPRDPAHRGGHVALEHPEAERISEALRDREVIVDFRPPNVIRVAPAPLYVRYEDVYDVVEIVADIIDEKRYEAYEAAGDVT